MYKIVTKIPGSATPIDIRERGVITNTEQVMVKHLNWIYITNHSVIYLNNEEVEYSLEHDETLVYHHSSLPSYYNSTGVEWYNMGRRHRLNGPSWTNYSSDQAHWNLFGADINPEKYFSWLEETGIDINNISDSDKLLITIQWSHYD